MNAAKLIDQYVSDVADHLPMIIVVGLIDLGYKVRRRRNFSRSA
jgi:hypothetical protein